MNIPQIWSNDDEVLESLTLEDVIEKLNTTKTRYVPWIYLKAWGGEGHPVDDKKETWALRSFITSDPAGFVDET